MGFLMNKQIIFITVHSLFRWYSERGEMLAHLYIYSQNASLYLNIVQRLSSSHCPYKVVLYIYIYILYIISLSISFCPSLSRSLSLCTSLSRFLFSLLLSLQTWFVLHIQTKIWETKRKATNTIDRKNPPSYTSPEVLLYPNSGKRKAIPKIKNSRFYRRSKDTIRKYRPLMINWQLDGSLSPCLFAQIIERMSPRWIKKSSNNNNNSWKYAKEGHGGNVITLPVWHAATTRNTTQIVQILRLKSKHSQPLGCRLVCQSSITIPTAHINGEKYEAAPKPLTKIILRTEIKMP